MTDEIYALDLDSDLAYHLADPDSVAVLLGEQVTADLIEDEYIAKIFDWQVEHTRTYGRPATGSRLEEQFDELALDKPDTVIEDLIGRLRERWLKNNGRNELTNLAAAYKKDPNTLAHEMVSRGRDLLDLTSRRGDSYTSADWDRAIRRYDENVTRGRGPSFGYEEVDDYLYGQRGTTFFIGPPGGYKSWQIVNAVNVNVRAGLNVWHYPLELPADETDMRIRCNAADIPFWRYLRNELSIEDRKKLKAVSEELDDLGTYHVMKPPPGERDIDSLVYRALDDGADVIFIDQLQYVERILKRKDGNIRMSLGSGETKDYWDVLNKARDLADKVPICFAHQFNRTIQAMDQMPDMQQIKGSAAVEETGTLVLGLWANKDMQASNVVELGTLKMRNVRRASWTIQVNLSNGCNFEMLGKNNDDD